MNGNMYKSPSIPQSNPPSGTGHAVFSGGSPIQDRACLGGLVNESACAICSVLGRTNVNWWE